MNIAQGFASASSCTYAPGHVDGPNIDGISTAAINVGDHGAAIEFHAKTTEEAQGRRDYVLALIAMDQLQRICTPPNSGEPHTAFIGSADYNRGYQAALKWCDENWDKSAVREKEGQPELTVWYGAMPESNGKSNFTAILKRKGAGPFDTCHITIDRSEYPDRVRYEADRVRWIIGELKEEPCITDYDANKHSGYVRRQPVNSVADNLEAQLHAVVRERDELRTQIKELKENKND